MTGKGLGVFGSGDVVMVILGDAAGAVTRGPRSVSIPTMT